MEPSPGARAQGEVRSVQRVLSIIETLGQAEDGMTLAVLSRALSLPHATTHRLLANLEGRGFVARHTGSDAYFLSTRILQLQATIASRASLVKPAIPELAALAERYGCAAHLAVLGEDRVVYVETRRANPYSLEYLPPGRTAPIHSTALGRVMAAFLSVDQRRALVGRLQLVPRTARTITDGACLLQHLEEVQRQGFAFDDEQHNEGQRCLAVPVRDHSGRVVAAMSVSMSASQLPPERIAEVLSGVRPSAERVSRALGWIPSAI